MHLNKPENTLYSLCWKYMHARLLMRDRLHASQPYGKPKVSRFSPRSTFVYPSASHRHGSSSTHVFFVLLLSSLAVETSVFVVNIRSIENPAKHNISFCVHGGIGVQNTHTSKQAKTPVLSPTYCPSPPTPFLIPLRLGLPPVLPRCRPCSLLFMK